VPELPADLTVSVGDGTLSTLGLLLAALAILLLVQLGRLTKAKAQRLPPGKAAPWTGRYETKVPAKAVVEKGRTLPPPQASGEGATWRLARARSSSAWLVVLFVVAVLGALAFGQLQVPPGQQLISTSPGAPPAPAPPPTAAPPLVRQLHHHVTRDGTVPRHLRDHRRHTLSHQRTPDAGHR
jgi:hypothetical protein